MTGDYVVKEMAMLEQANGTLVVEVEAETGERFKFVGVRTVRCVDRDGEVANLTPGGK